MSERKPRLHTHQQATAYSSPWSLAQKLRMLMWEWCWLLMCRWTPKPMNAWRLLWLRLHGAKIHGRPFVHQRARVAIPWNLTLHDRACLGDGAVAYSLGEIEIMRDATVAQEAYLCTGSHDFNNPVRPLVTGKILIGRSAFVGARAFVMPGVTVGDNAIIGACSVVTKDVSANTCVAGNPARVISKQSK
ncbi:MAG TPA: DapH/DapD/GlmU-related protein [Gallionella sp.]|nr:DapH/DapD/GlmU-related protein [Gallionella sp.]